MTKFISPRTLLLSATAALVIASGTGMAAYADNQSERPSEITLEMALEKAGEHFDRADADRNGTITQEEADAAKAQMQSRGGDRMAERLTEAFNRIDSDGDGVISQGDRGYGRLADRLDLEGDLTLEQVQAGAAAKMEQRATDRETERSDDAPSFPMTRDQALANAEAKFNERDVNGDGVLSGDEIPQGGKGRGHGKRGGDNN